MYDGAWVDAGWDTGDLAPDWRPGPLRPTHGDWGARDHVAGPTAELSQLACREGLLVVELEVGRQWTDTAVDCLTTGWDL